MATTILKKTPDASVPIPPLGSIAIFIDSLNVPKMKLDNGVVIPFASALGSGVDAESIDTLLFVSQLSKLILPSEYMTEPTPGVVKLDLGILQNGVFYTNPVPTTANVGGIDAGSVFSNISVSDLFDLLLYPQLSPAFLTFLIAGQSTIMEVGDTIPAGNKTFNWTANQPAFVIANSLSIEDYITFFTIGSGLANDGSEILPIPLPIQKITPQVHKWRINGQNTKLQPFYRDFIVSWRWRTYYGSDINPILTEAQIEALNNSVLAADDLGTFTLLGNGYKFYCFASSFGSPTLFRDFDTNMAVAMADVSDGYTSVANGINYLPISITNIFGITTTYKVYRSKNILSASIKVIVS